MALPLLYRIMALVFALAPIFAAPADAQTPERRFALVIGNTEYKAGRLPTAANDAGLIAETLRIAGFDVAGARDLDQDTLRRSFREFLDKVSAAGPEAVSVIYLAGYGLQFEGENYIVPIDATIARDDDIPIEAVRISDFTRSLAGTAGGVKLVVFDAARQHPYTPTGPQLASGLALVEPDPGMMIAFNTAPGSVAPIESEPYGAFAQALAEMIGTGGVGLDDMFARLRLRVNEMTGGVSVPWYASKITRPFMFTEPTPDAPPPPQQVASLAQLQSRPIQQFGDDQQAYVAALERDTIASYQDFIAAYPDSPHVRRARALIAVRREAILWRRALSLNTREAYWSYLHSYPQGAHVADCERRLARLAADYDPPPAFVPMAFADVAPPPPDEVVYLTQPEVVFDDPVFVPPPAVPAFFCPPRRPEFVALPPPQPPVGSFFLPTPVVSFFSGPRPWVRPPRFVVAPPRPPIQQITINNATIINNTTIINQRPVMRSPALPAVVVARVNSGALRVPPPAPPAVLHNASLQHPGVSVLGTQVPPPPRVHTAVTTPGVSPALPGALHPPVPGTATMTPGAPHVPALPGGPHPPGRPGTAATTPGAMPPHTAPPPPAPHFATPSPPAHAAPPAPPPATHMAPPPPVTHNPPPPAPHTAAPSPPAHAAPPAPLPAHTAPPPTHNPPPPAPHVATPRPPPAHGAPQAGGKRCTVENGREVCR
jgi:uncharacterized caspase-like protein